MTTATIRRYRHGALAPQEEEAQGAQEGLSLRRLSPTVTVALFAPVPVIAAVVGDLAMAAAITGFFTVLNTYLVSKLSRKIDAHHSDLVAPRQIIHDEDGRAVASVVARDYDHPTGAGTPARRRLDHLPHRRSYDP